MAQTLNDDDERKRRVILVGNLFKETGLSTRKLAAYLTDNFFPISNCTVSDYMQRYMKLKPDEVEIIKAKVFDNSPDSLNKKEVRDRVQLNADLFEKGFTIQEIADSTGKNFWIVYRDITSRLRVFDNDRYINKIKPKLDENKYQNLDSKKK